MKELETTQMRDLATVVKHKAENARDCLYEVASNMSNFRGWNSEIERIANAREDLRRAEAYVAECRKTFDKLDKEATAKVAESELKETTF